MPLVLSGSTGIAGVDGSASTPAVQGTDTNTGIAFPAADTVAVATGGTERMRVDSSGNVGIGTSAPGVKLDVNGVIRSTGTSAILSVSKRSTGTGDAWGMYSQSGELNFYDYIAAVSRMVIDTNGNVAIGADAGNTLRYLDINNTNTDASAGSILRLITSNAAGSGNTSVDMVKYKVGGFIIGNNDTAAANYTSFHVGASERARITSGGEFLVGVTSGPGGSGDGRVTSRGISSRAGYNGSFSTNVININWTGSAQLWVDTTNIGTFSFTSDYRIKRNIETQDQPALDRVLQLRPVTYQMADYGNLIKASDDVREGFIAHELAAVIPSAVSGEKDAPDQLQSLKIDALCSVLVKAIQELKAENDDLKARLTALEAK